MTTSGSPLQVIVRESDEGTFTQTISSGSHTFLADEPLGVGGNDLGPNPYDLLLAALGACTSMTLRMYARHKQIPLERVTVRLRHAKIHAKDCGDCESDKGMVDRIERDIVIEGDLDDAQRERLMQIADRCPVHRSLHSEVKIVTQAVSA